jgi:hypothetical protein
MMMKAISTSETSSVSTSLNGAKFQMTIIFTQYLSFSSGSFTSSVTACIVAVVQAVTSFLTLASYTMGTGGSVPGDKAWPGRDADQSLPSSAEVKKE